MSERGYGWEKLISEMFCQEYWAERKLETHIARFHNVYGPNGTWDGGREKAPAALSRNMCSMVGSTRYIPSRVIRPRFRSESSIVCPIIPSSLDRP